MFLFVFIYTVISFECLTAISFKKGKDPCLLVCNFACNRTFNAFLSVEKKAYGAIGEYRDTHKLVIFL